MKTLNDIEHLIDAIAFEDNEADLLAMDEVVQAIRHMPQPRDAVPILFRWFEKHGSDDVGSPGPFVHFIEEELDYFPILKNSLATRPTEHTAWMANRIANGEKDREKIDQWIDVLKAVARHPLANEECKETAEKFVAHQSKRQ